jgi:hypothetical protein
MSSARVGITTIRLHLHAVRAPIQAAVLEPAHDAVVIEDVQHACELGANRGFLFGRISVQVCMGFLLLKKNY